MLLNKLGVNEVRQADIKKKDTADSES